MSAVIQVSFINRGDDIAKKLMLCGKKIGFRSSRAPPVSAAPCLTITRYAPFAITESPEELCEAKFLFRGPESGQLRRAM